MYKIDCHSHFFEPFIMEGISKILKDHKIEEKSINAILTNRKLLTAEERLREMDCEGIDVSAIEYQVVWQHYDELKYPSSVRVLLSKFINDRLSEVTRKYPDRYFMMADIPLLNVEASIEELQRCFELGAKGLCLNTSINGKPLTGPEFQSFWVEVNRLGMPVFLHPRSNIEPQRISQQHIYHPMVGYPFDTTIAGIDLLMDDFFNKYQRVNIMLAHCGGALPFIRKRLDSAVTSGNKLSPFLNSFFYEAAMSSTHQLEFTIDEVGLEQVCYGSDYPFFQFGDAVKEIEALGLEDANKEKIFYRNALRFFGIS